MSDVLDDRSPSRGDELKTDLRWATALLLVLVLTAPVLLNYAAPYVSYVWRPVFGSDFTAPLGPGYHGWQGAPAGNEDIVAVTDEIFAQQGLVAPFEILSVLLLAALIAGVVIAFRDPERDA